MTQQVRHRPPASLELPREIVLVCPALRSNINLARIVRLAGCAGITRIITSGNQKVDGKIARDAAETVEIIRKRTLTPALIRLKSEGFQIVGLEQTEHSKSLHSFAFDRKTALLIGHERHGIESDQLAVTDCCVEIPVWGMPFSYNVATATTMAVYEYCRQFPTG